MATPENEMKSRDVVKVVRELSELGKIRDLKNLIAKSEQHEKSCMGTLPDKNAPISWRDFWECRLWLGTAFVFKEYEIMAQCVELQDILLERLAPMAFAGQVHSRSDLAGLGVGQIRERLTAISDDLSCRMAVQEKDDTDE